MKTPLKVSLVCLFLNLILNLLLMHPLKQGGIALATVVCSYLNNICLIVLLQRQVGGIPFRKTGLFLLKLVAASAVSVVLAYLFYCRTAPDWFRIFRNDGYVPRTGLAKLGDFLLQSVPLGFSFVMAGAVFLFLAMFLRVEETNGAVEKVRRLFGKLRKKRSND